MKGGGNMANTSGSTKILELWIDCVERVSSFDVSSAWNEGKLRNYFYEGKLYKENMERYKTCVKKKLLEYLKQGENVGIFAQHSQRWRLADSVTLIFKESNIFKGERKNDPFNSIKVLVKKIKNNTWSEYYRVT